jgi:membrane protein DedA with SNARE-associated domain
MHGFLVNIGYFIIHTIGSLGYIGITLLMAIESAAIPLPSEIIMPVSGLLVLSGKFSFFGVAFAGAIGSTIGSLIIYIIGFYGGRPLLLKYGRYVLISHHDMEIAEKFFNKYGWWALFTGRLLPVIRTYISLPAGISKAGFYVLTVSCFAGSFLWSVFLEWAGIKLGKNWSLIEPYFRRFDFLIVIVFVIFIFLWIFRHINQKIL